MPFAEYPPTPSLHTTMSLLRAAVFLALMMMLLPVQAQVHNTRVSELSSPAVNLIPLAYHLEDPEADLGLEQVLQQPMSQRAFRGSSTASFGFSHAAHWFVIPLQNSGDESLSRLLVFEPTWLDDVQVYVVNEQGVLQHYQGGDRLPFAERGYAIPRINVELQLPPGESQLVVRTQTSDPYIVKMTLWDSEAFLSEDGNNKMYLGLVYGVLVAMMLYNLLLYISIREQAYLAYVFYLLCFVAMHFTYSGNAYALLWPDSPLWSNWAHAVFIHLFVFAGLYFVVEFLQLKTRMPKAYRWVVSWMLLIAAIFLLSSVVGGYDLNVDISIFWVAFYAPMVILLGVMSLRAGNRAARFFLTAVIAGFIGSFITAITVSGLLPFTFVSFRAVDFGMILDAILLSIALADRLRLARLETEQIKQSLLETTQEHARMLEEQVAQRTAELSEISATKDKFMSIIGHDLKGPINGLQALFSRVVRHPEDMNEELLGKARQSIHNTRELLEQLFTWARSQRGQLGFHPERVDAARMLHNIQDLYGLQASTKGISITLSLGDSYWVYADKAMLHTIFRNLVSNAIKYTYNGGCVSASVIDEGDYYVFSIQDTGLGMSERKKNALFQLGSKPQSSHGTAREVGTGLGLILCAEFVEQHGGSIGVESEPGKGSRFWFTMPKG